MIDIVVEVSFATFVQLSFFSIFCTLKQFSLQNTLDVWLTMMITTLPWRATFLKGSLSNKWTTLVLEMLRWLNGKTKPRGIRHLGSRRRTFNFWWGLPKPSVNLPAYSSR
jgi:hypothetical protein